MNRNELLSQYGLNYSPHRRGGLSSGSISEVTAENLMVEPDYIIGQRFRKAFLKFLFDNTRENQILLSLQPALDKITTTVEDAGIFPDRPTSFKISIPKTGIERIGQTNLSADGPIVQIQSLLILTAALSEERKQIIFHASSDSVSQYGWWTAFGKFCEENGLPSLSRYTHLPLLSGGKEKDKNNNIARIIISTFDILQGELEKLPSPAIDRTAPIIIADRPTKRQQEKLWQSGSGRLVLIIQEDEVGEVEIKPIDFKPPKQKKQNENDFEKGIMKPPQGLKEVYPVFENSTGIELSEIDEFTLRDLGLDEREIMAVMAVKELGFEATLNQLTKEIADILKTKDWKYMRSATISLIASAISKLKALDGEYE